MITEQLCIFDQPPPKAPAPPSRPRVLLRDERLGKRLIEMADKLQRQIDDKLADRQTNTPKRMAQAMSARCEGERLQRVQTVMRGLAGLHLGEGCPANLAGFKTKKAIYEAMSSELQHVPNGFHAYHVDRGEPSDRLTADQLALWDFLQPKTPEQEQAEWLAQLERDLQGRKIPGFFPTPRAVIDRMLDYAGIEAGHRVLEPSAGNGAILDVLKEQHPDAELTAYEYAPPLREILEAKGYKVSGADFFESYDLGEFDRVLMNPPFEKLQDVTHVFHAFDHLKAGGRLVAIMSPGPFFHNSKRAQEFRDFCDERGAEVHDLAAGTFKESGTGVASKLVIIDKE